MGNAARIDSEGNVSGSLAGVSTGSRGESLRKTEAFLADHRIAFICGLHRSGTSLLHRCLAEHPDVSGFSDTGVAEDEGQHLQSVYPPAYKFGGAGVFGFRDDAHLNEQSRLATQANAQRLLDDWQPYWDLSKPVLIEKSPPNLIRTRFLQALLPSSRFVVIMRHPVAVSYATQKWWRRVYLHQLLRHWMVCHERFAIDRLFLNRVFLLRYEDFVADPQAQLTRLWGFLDLSPTDVSAPVKTGVNERYYAIWRERVRNWYTRPYVRFVESKFGKRMQRFGYSFSDCRTTVSTL